MPPLRTQLQFETDFSACLRLLGGLATRAERLGYMELADDLDGALMALWRRLDAIRHQLPTGDRRSQYESAGDPTREPA